MKWRRNQCQCENLKSNMLTRNLLVILVLFSHGYSCQENSTEQLQNVTVEETTRNGNDSDAAATNETTTNPSPEFQFLLDPNVYYNILIEHLGDRPNANLIAYQMIDASSQTATGIFQGNTVDQGNFDECYNIHEGDIYGKFCIGMKFLDNMYDTMSDGYHANLSKLLSRYDDIKDVAKNQFSVKMIPYRLGVCMPHTMGTLEIPTDAFFLPEMCKSKTEKKEFSQAAFVTTSVTGSIFLVAVISTIYDVVLHYTQNKPAHWILVSFSYLKNGRSLLKTSKNGKNDLIIPCLAGIKVFSMLWVIWGHYTGMTSFSLGDNLFDIFELEKPLWNEITFNAQLSVDTFLLMGGMLTTYSFLIFLRKGHKFNLIMYYLNRYFRLIPLYAVIIFLSRDIAQYLTYGPYSYFIEKVVSIPCQDGWWSNLLFLGNYLHKEMCIGHSYYLHIDFQMYCLAPLVVLPLFKWPKYAFKALLALAALAIGVAYYSTWYLKAGNYVLDINIMKYHIIPTHTRFGGYVNGMVLGYVLYKAKTSGEKVKLSRGYVASLWIISLLIMITCLLGGHPILNKEGPRDRVVEALYVALNRPAWCLGVSIMIYLCTCGYGGPVNAFLSAKIFEIAAKLTYVIYLIHLPLIAIITWSGTALYQVNFARMFIPYVGMVFCCAVVGTLLTLTYETPFNNIQRLIFSRQRKSKKSAPTSPATHPRGLKQPE